MVEQHAQFVPDIIAPNLDILFCGINPGLTSAKTHHHFAKPGNRFWKALFLSGLTPRLLQPSEQSQLLQLGIGITNFVSRESASAKELTVSELESGTQTLIKKVSLYTPTQLAILGLGAYRKGFAQPDATLGKQPQLLGSTQIWLFPNPSGLNAHYSLNDFVQFFSKLTRSKR